MRCPAATYYAALSLLYCITLYYSCPPPLLIFRSSPPFHLPGGHVIFIHFLYGNGGYQIKKKTKSFLLLISCHKKISVSQYQYSSLSTVTLPYPNLTWLLSSFGVKLDIGVVPYAPRSPPRLTVFNRHSLFHNPVTCV